MPNTSSQKHGRIRDRDRDRDRNRAVIRSFFERVYSKGDLSLVDEVVASDFVGSSNESSERYLGPAGVKTHVSRLRRAFYGFTIEIDDLSLDGDTFEVTWTARGTHERRFLGVDPTCTIGRAGEEPHGSRIAVGGVTRGTVTNEEIQECEMVWDVKTLRHQLGSSGEVTETDTDSGKSSARKPLLLGQGNR